MRVPGSLDATDMKRFLASFLYGERAFLVDEIVGVDSDEHRIRARMDTTRELPIAPHQRVGPGHPPACRRQRCSS